MVTVERLLSAGSTSRTRITYAYTQPGQPGGGGGDVKDMSTARILTLNGDLIGRYNGETGAVEPNLDYGYSGFTFDDVVPSAGMVVTIDGTDSPGSLSFWHALPGASDYSEVLGYFGLDTTGPFPITVTIPADSFAVGNILGFEANRPITGVTVASVPAPSGLRLTSTATSSARLDVTPPPRAATDNRSGGRWRGGLGTVDWTPDPAPVPPGVEVRLGLLHAQAFTPTLDAAGRVTLSNLSRASVARPHDRIVVGGRDVTYFRGVVTPLPSYTLVKPLGYGPGSLSLPQVSAAFERPGVGALSWLRPGAPVLVQRVDPTTRAVIATDYRGIVLDFDHTGDALQVTLGGQASGRAVLRQKQVPIFRWRSDVGRLAQQAISSLGLPFAPRFGPVTGIKALHFGGGDMLGYIAQLCALAQTRDGDRWSVMPTWAGGPYRLTKVDRTTIAGTVYNDDGQSAAPTLRRGLVEEPNRIFVTGVTPEGMRVRFGRYPGLKQTPPPRYPFRDGRSFGLGTTDADTDTGDGVSLLVNRLYVTKYLTLTQTPGGYDVDVRRAVRDLQRDAGLGVTGTVTPRTWRRLYDLGATGFSLRGAHIGAASEGSATKRWHHTASGARVRRNPGYRPSVLPVDRNVDMGSGYSVDQMREWAHAERAEAATPNYTGTITFPLGGLVRGAHTPGSPLDAGDVLDARALRPGHNLRLPLFAGGITVHVSAVEVATSGDVTATVDTRARDSAEVWEVIARDRESRRSPRREWIRQHRASTQSQDSVTPWDEVGGVLYAPVDVAGGRWTVFPVIAGQEGTVSRLRLNTNPNREFVVAVFGRRVGPRRLQRLVGNPLSKRGAKRWENEDVRERLDRDFLLYAAGTDEQPCGYFPRQKIKLPITETVQQQKVDEYGDPVTDADGKPVTESVTREVPTKQARLTGRWQDDASFGYRTFDQPVLWVAVYAEKATTIPRGRIMWPQLDSGS